MTDDAELIRRYAEQRSEEAFAELVRRHLGLVYAAALRRLGGDAHGAADVAQGVFVKLARDAARLSGHGALTGWLYAATRNPAVDAIRANQRRAAREREAFTMNEILSAEVRVGAAAETEVEWARLRPVLDAAMDALEPKGGAETATTFRATRGLRGSGVGFESSRGRGGRGRGRRRAATRRVHGSRVHRCRSEKCIRANRAGGGAGRVPWYGRRRPARASRGSGVGASFVPPLTRRATSGGTLILG